MVHCLPKILRRASADGETEVTPARDRCGRCFLRAKLFFHLTAFLENTIQSGFIGSTVSVEVIAADLGCWLMEQKNLELKLQPITFRVKMMYS